MNTKGIYRQKVWVYVGQHELVVERHMLTRFSDHLWARIREVAYGPENTTRILADRVTAQKMADDELRGRCRYQDDDKQRHIYQLSETGMAEVRGGKAGRLTKDIRVPK